MTVDPTRVDPVAAGLDPGLLVQVEEMLAVCFLDAQSVPVGSDVTMTAGGAAATITTIVNQVNEPFDSVRAMVGADLS